MFQVSTYLTIIKGSILSMIKYFCTNDRMTNNTVEMLTINYSLK